MSVTFESSQDILLKLEEEDPKKKIQFEKKVKKKVFLSYPSFIFILYTIISLNLRISLKINYIPR